jgi:hypothetical protein
MTAYWIRSSKGTILRVPSWVASRIDGAGSAGLLHLEPAGGAQAPAVAGFEARKAVLRHGGREVVAEGLGGFEEGGVDDAADGVDAEVVGAGLAAAGAVEAGHRLAAADAERLAKDVFAASFDGFSGRHGFLIKEYVDVLPTQKRMIQRLHANLIHVGGQLDRVTSSWQAWLKIEHQPQIYHWIPIFNRPADLDSTRALLDLHAKTEGTYGDVRASAIQEVATANSSLTDKQRGHIERANKSLNLAIRHFTTSSSSHNRCKSFSGPLTVQDPVATLQLRLVAAGTPRTDPCGR